MTLKEQLLQEIEQAPESVLEKLLQFLRLLQTPEVIDEPSTDPPIWELFERFTDSLPDEAATQLPSDGAAQLDHYLYGSPKQPE